MKNSYMTRSSRLGWTALFASTGTLICCALPIALVTFGFGAAIAVLSSNLPFLVTLTVQKTWLFAGSGALIALSGWFIFQPGQACPADPKLRSLCDRAQLWNRRIFWISVVVWGVGFFAAYFALPLRILFEN